MKKDAKEDNMGFMSAVQDTLNTEWNRSRTDNGALVHRTSGRALLDLNFSVSTMRCMSGTEIFEKFMDAYREDPAHALKWLFYARDVRGGLGERRLFRTILYYLISWEEEIVRNLIPLIPEYGRWDDLWCLLKTPLENDVVEFVRKQFYLDMEAAKEGKPISLLAKWMPSMNASSKESKEYGMILSKRLGTTPRQYRKILSSLRAKLRIVERSMSAKKWNEIEYEHVPSRANLLYKDAFLRNDETRRKAYLESVKSGESKINAGTLFPHDIIHKYGYVQHHAREDDAVESLWKSLPDSVEGNGNTICVADGSGSMTAYVSPKSQITCLDVANSLAIYFSERCTGEFRNQYITFSRNPQLVRFGERDSLLKKLKITRRHYEVANTNVEATFRLILDTAVSHHMSQEDMPKTILILSDMQFDCAVSGNPNVTLFDHIRAEYESAGYKLPRLVFWNICGRTDTIPVRENDLGVALVSGFSTNIVRMVLSDNLDPYACLLAELDSIRYKPVGDAIAGMCE